MYYGNKLEPWQVPLHEIIKEFRTLADPTQGRNTHTQAAPIITYEWLTYIWYILYTQILVAAVFIVL